MDSTEFLNGILRPTLMQIDMWSYRAERLMLATAIHESGGFKHKLQVGGPAKSYYQIEPATLADLKKNYLSYRPEKAKILEKVEPVMLDGSDMLMDDVYSTVACRLIYSRIPEPLPVDIEGCARYWKSYFNTYLGKGTQQKFLDDWYRWKPEGYDE